MRGMIRRFAQAATVMVSVAMAVGGAEAGVMLDFNHITASPFAQFSVYEEDGFQLAASGAGVVSAHPASYPFLDAGSRSMHIGNPNNTVELSKVGGGTFALRSIKLSEYNSNSDNSITQVHFTGYTAGGATLSASVPLDGTFGFQTHIFAGFTDLTRVTWVQSDALHQFDDIEVEGVPDLAAVPEPSSVATVGVGTLLALGYAWRRRRAA